MQLLNQSYDPAVRCDTLLLHPDNPNEGNVGLISKSIETLGFYGSCVVQLSTRRILAGNHRYKGALENGAETVPVTWLDVDDDTARRILLMDNKAGSEATMNEPALQELLKKILGDTGTLEGTGYTNEELDDLVASASKEAAETEAPGDPGGNRYKEQYGVIVMCESAGQQEDMYNRLVGEGLQVKVVVT